MNFIPLLVSTDRFIKRDLPGGLFCPEHHEKLIFYTTCCVCSKPVPLIAVERGNGFDQANRTDGDQIIRVGVCSLVFLTICATSRRLRSIRMFFSIHVALFVFLEILSFLLNSQWLLKCFQKQHLERIYFILCREKAFRAFPPVFGCNLTGSMIKSNYQ